MKKITFIVLTSIFLYSCTREAEVVPEEDVELKVMSPITEEVDGPCECEGGTGSGFNDIGEGKVRGYAKVEYDNVIISVTAERDANGNIVAISHSASPKPSPLQAHVRYRIGNKTTSSTNGYINFVTQVYEDQKVYTGYIYGWHTLTITEHTVKLDFNSQTHSYW